MLRAELKKIIAERKKLTVLALFLSAYFLFCSFKGYDSSYEIDSNEASYLEYINRFQGRLTSEKAELLEDEYRSVNYAAARLTEIRNSYREGSMTEELYRQKLTETIALQQNKDIFQVLYRQYYYVKADPSRRYLMDERGWNTLLVHDEINILLIIYIILQSIPVFCGEYESGMNQLLLSCRKGRFRLAALKLFLSAGLAAAAVLLFEGMKVIFIMAAVGLKGGSYPLQSLSYFQSSPYTASIGQAYGAVLVCRCLGGAMLALFICALSAALKHTALSAFAGLLTAVVPYLTGDRSFKYLLPLPGGLLSGNGFIWGRKISAGYDEQWNLDKIISFRGISPCLFGWILAGHLFLAGILVCFCLKHYTGIKIKRKAFMPLLIMLPLVALSGLAGCNKISGETEEFHFLEEQKEWETGEYRITFDPEQNKIYAMDINTNEIFLLNRNPLDGGTVISGIYVTNKNCYYLVREELAVGFEIFCIDLRNFGERLEYSSREDNTADFWGLAGEELTEDRILSNNYEVSSFMLNIKYIYYIRRGQLRRINRLSRQEDILTDISVFTQKLLYRQHRIYYEDELGSHVWEEP